MNSPSYSPLHAHSTYVVRNGRIRASQRRALAEHWDKYAIPFCSAPHNFAHDFPSPADRLILEIGSGMGDAAITLARRHPAWNIVAAEMYWAGLGKTVRKIAEENLTNLRLIRHDAVAVLHEMAAPHTIDGIHIFFPDPWPKKRHHKRRLIQPGFPELIAPVLTAESYLYIVTDWEEYAFQIAAVIGDSPLFRIYHEDDWSGTPFSPPQSWRPSTAFEKKAIREGRTIFEIYAFAATATAANPLSLP